MGRWMRWSGVLAVSVLAGCGDSTPPPVPQDFPPLHYDYLTPIRLNVADVEVDDRSMPPDGDLASRSPVRPADALERMAHDRLVAAGPSGTATFVVTEASITRGDGGITAHLAARLEISNANGGHAGYAEAHVTRTERAGTEAPAGPASLYELVRQAMDDMNVEFEYQVRHTLADWIVSSSAVEAPVVQTPLGQGPAGQTPSGQPSNGQTLNGQTLNGQPAVGDTTPSGRAGAPMPLTEGAPPPGGTPAMPVPAPGAFDPAGSGPDAAGPMSLAPPPVAGNGSPPEGASMPPAQMSPPPGFLAPPPGVSSQPSFVPPSVQAPGFPPAAPQGY